MQANKSILTRLLILGFSLQISSCSDLELLYDQLRGKKAEIDGTEYTPVPGTPATQSLSKTLSDSVVGSAAQVSALDVAIEDIARTNLVSMGLMLANSEKAISASTEAFDQLVGSEKKKKDLVPDDYEKIDATYFNKLGLADTDYSADTVTWGDYSDTSFTIPALDRMPVRDQGKRGTCATFAGVGLIESLIIQQSSGSLPFKEIDLSEQRFYFLSKPDSWATGGDVKKQGSDSGTGFMRSSGGVSGHPIPTDTGGSSYNIPLEADCPYNPKLGSTDLQIPLSEGCKSKGVLRVTKFTAWGGDVGGENTIEHAQQIYEELRRNKAVIVYTKLSSNWEKNDGMVTLKGAGGSGATSHASGHAYLIVGARKIDEKSFPGEGGMCFIIRNSWGTGWGVKGLSCMTLKWFNAWRFSGPLPTVDEIELVDAAKNKITLASQRPSALPEPDPATRKNRGGTNVVKRKGRVVIGLTEDTRSKTVASPWMPNAYGLKAMADVDLMQLTADEMKYGRLVSDDDSSYKMLYAVSDTSLVLRGILSGDTTQTHSLELKRVAGALIADLAGKGEVQVGEFRETSGEDGATAVAVVCGEKYASLCDLHYEAESNELLIGVSRLEAQKQSSTPPYNWESLQIAGYGFQMSRPQSALTKFDVRLVNDGVESNPQRLKLDPTSGNISNKGETVGNLTQGALCSGAFSENCRVVKSGNNFEIFPKSK